MYKLIMSMEKKKLTRMAGPFNILLCSSRQGIPDLGNTIQEVHVFIRPYRGTV